VNGQDLANAVVRYFDLYSRKRTTVAAGMAKTAGSTPPWWWQLLLYLALLAGIFAKGLLDYFTGKAVDPFNWGRSFAAVVASLVAFPGAYKAAMAESGPGFVQLD
jgi:hypothetical protein